MPKIIKEKDITKTILKIPIGGKIIYLVNKNIKDKKKSKLKKAIRNGSL